MWPPHAPVEPEALVKLEYIPAGAPNCPLIRLYDFTSAEACHLQAAVSGLASGRTERVEVDLLPFVEAVGGCRLALVRRKWDQAAIACGRDNEFECGLTAGSWEDVSELIKPFAEGANGFQWLAGVPGEAALLLSPTGQW
jgi:hypothetical protein